ncbi:HIT family protein [Bacteroidota bacterium]
MDCIFCNIVNKKSDAEIIFENENIVAFLDIRPINYGHTLVVSKKHYDNILTVPADEIAEIMKVTQFIAGTVKRSVNADGFNVISNNGDPAGQTVYHFHFHIIPRFADDFTFKPRTKNYLPGAMNDFGNIIRSVISKYKDIYNG